MIVPRRCHPPSFAPTPQKKRALQQVGWVRDVTGLLRASECAIPVALNAA